MRTAILLTLVLFIASCKQTEYVTIPSLERDSIYITKTERDTLLVRDSVFVKDRGDTVYVEKWKTIYKSRVSTDTMSIERTDSIPYPVEVVKERRYIPKTIGILALLGAVAIGAIILWLINKFRK
jgi:hypothetical protein